MAVLASIIPIFAVIALGVWGARKGFFPPGFVGPANRLTYYLAIPALVLRSMAKAPLDQAFQPWPALVALAAMVAVWGLAVWLSGRLYGPDPAQGPRRASFIQGAVHGNQAQLGFAVIFYALGDAGLNTALIIAAVVIIGQNLLSVLSFTFWGGGGRVQAANPVKAVLFNPIIAVTLAGLAFPILGVKLPEVVDRTLGILGNLGLPLALLIIGAKLSEGKLGGRWWELGLISFVKLLALPALGWGLLSLFGLGGLPATVAVLLLSSPIATIAAVMAGELGGDALLSGQGTTLTHALSVATYSLWLLLLVN
ncbi:MAG: AEC family transporter [Thermodesulfobacteriota bacterium]